MMTDVSGFDCEKYREMEDKSFIRLIVEGDEGARLRFKEMYLDGLARSVVFRRYPGLKSYIEDICQDLWVYFTERNWQAVRNFLSLLDSPNPPKLRPYFAVVIGRFIVKRPNYKRTLFAHFVPLIVDADEENGPGPLERIRDPEPGPDQVIEDNEAREKIEKVADFILREVMAPGGTAGLSEREREIVRLRCVARRSSAEVAELFGMNICAVDTALSRAKGKIRRFCEARGMSEAIKEALRDAEC
jgi:RNA polymerase sigma factor (sigma-70 family)